MEHVLWWDQNLLLFSCMSSVLAIPAFSNPVIELFRDACTEKFWKKIALRFVSEKSWSNSWIQKSRDSRVTVHEKRITVDFISTKHTPHNIWLASMNRLIYLHLHLHMFQRSLKPLKGEGGSDQRKVGLSIYVFPTVHVLKKSNTTVQHALHLPLKV